MENRTPVGIYGAGGFARELAWLIDSGQAQLACEVAGFIDDSDRRVNQLGGRSVYSWDNFREVYPAASIAIAVGDPAMRQSIADKCARDGYSFQTLRHPSAQMSESVALGPGSVICSGSILTVDIHVHEQVHINLSCTVGHDVVIGAYSTLAPGVHVSGNVHIGRGAYIGTGANIINGTADRPLVIGDGCVVAAGACVTGSTEPDTLYAGVPAKAKKKLR